jgi:hypothetical protein
LPAHIRHYAGNPVKFWVQIRHGSVSGWGVVEELLIEPDPIWLIVLLGVVALAGQHRNIVEIGAEVGAGLTDRFVVAVHVGWSLAPAVSEHALVLLTEPLHVRSFGVGGQLVAV